MSKKPLGNPMIAASAASSIPKGVWYILGAGVLGILGYTVYKGSKTVDSITSAVGLTDSEEDKEVEAFQKTTDYRNGFDPNYYKKVGSDLSDEQAATHAEAIYDAFDFFDDDEEEIYGVFRRLNKLADLSKVCDAYYKDYTEDLYQVLVDGLSSEEMTIVIDMIKQYK